MTVIGFYSHYMFMKWYRYISLFPTLPEMDSYEVSRIGSIPNVEFLLCYDQPKKPVILTDEIKRWGCWDIDILLSKYSDYILKCSSLNIFGNRIRMTFSQYIKYMLNQEDPNPLTISDNGFGERIPGLVKDYNIPEYFKQDFFSLLSKRPHYRELSIGPSRSGIPWSIEQYSASMWNGLVKGKRRWALYPSNILPPGLKSDYLESYQPQNSFNWFLNIYPHLPSNLKPIEFTQREGELVFVPTGWWYTFVNIENSISVSHNFVNEQNIYLSIESMLIQGNLIFINELKDKLKQIRPDIYQNIIQLIEFFEKRSGSDIIKNIQGKDGLIDVKKRFETDVNGINKTENVNEVQTM